MCGDNEFVGGRASCIGSDAPLARAANQMLEGLLFQLRSESPQELPKCSWSLDLTCCCCGTQ